MKNTLQITERAYTPEATVIEDHSDRLQAIHGLGTTLNVWWGKTPHHSTPPERTPGIALATWLFADSVVRRTNALHILLQSQDGIFLTWGALFNLARNGQREDIQARLLELLNDIARGYDPRGAPFPVKAMSKRTLLHHLPLWIEVMRFDDEMRTREWTHFDSWRDWMNIVWCSTPEAYREAMAKRSA